MRLFPRLGDILGARVLATMPEDTWRTLLLVASEETFPVYFQLAIPSGGISNADLASKLEHFGDTNQFAATLIELARDPGPDAPQRLQAFLSRLENHIGESGEREEIEAAMRALFQAANELLRREESGRLDIDISQHLRRIVRRLLLQVEQDERVSLLEEGIGSGGSIATTTDIVIMLGQQHGKYGGEWTEGAETLVTLSQLAQVENLALTAVRDEAEGGSLLGAPKMGDALTCWASWNRGECRAWVVAVDRDGRGAGRVPAAVHAQRRAAERERTRAAGREPARSPAAAAVPGAGRDRRPGQEAGRAAGPHGAGKAADAPVRARPRAAPAGDQRRLHRGREPADRQLRCLTRGPSQQRHAPVTGDTTVPGYVVTGVTPA